MEDTRLPKSVMFGELVGGAGCMGGQEKEWIGCLLNDLRAFKYQRRPVDDCSPGRGGMAQDGGTRGGTFHGEMGRCRETQGWTTAYSSRYSGMPERDGKDQGQDRPKASVFVLVRVPSLISHKWCELASSIFYFLALRLFRLRLFVSVETATSFNRSSICMRPDSHTQVLISNN